jgi:hypothetical protein
VDWGCGEGRPAIGLGQPGVGALIVRGREGKGGKGRAAVAAGQGLEQAGGLGKARDDDLPELGAKAVESGASGGLRPTGRFPERELLASWRMS